MARLRSAFMSSFSRMFMIVGAICVGVVIVWTSYVGAYQTLSAAPYAVTTATDQLRVVGQIRREAVEKTTDGIEFIWLGTAFPVEILQLERRGIVESTLWLHPSTTAAQFVYGDRAVALSVDTFRAPRRLQVWVDQPIASAFPLHVIQIEQNRTAQDAQLPIAWAFSGAQWQTIGDMFYVGWLVWLWSSLFLGWALIWRTSSRLLIVRYIVWGMIVVGLGWYAPIHAFYGWMSVVFVLGLALSWVHQRIVASVAWWLIVAILGLLVLDMQALDNGWYVVGVLLWGLGIAVWVRQHSTVAYADTDTQMHGYRPDIDGMRAIAVLAVVIYHAFPHAIKGGFIGVDMFFVLSGYLITQIVIKEVWQQRFTLTDFYARRVRRIFPALSVVFVVVMLVCWLILFPDEYTLFMQTVVASIAFVANIFFYTQVDYFAPDTITQPLIHLWSLGVEEQFYIFWPLVIVWMRGRRHALLAMFIAVIVGSFATNIWWVDFDGSAAFYLPMSRFWELAVGGIVAWISIFATPSLSARLLTYRGWLSWIGIGLVLIGFWTIDENSLFPGYWALIPTIGTALLLVASGSQSRVQQLLAHPYAVRIGLISYPLYLWHWPVLVFGYLMLDGHMNHWLSGAMVVVSVLLAEATYRYIETPIRFTARQTIRVIWLLVVMGVIGGVGGLLWQIPVPTRMSNYYERYDVLPGWDIRNERSQHTSQTIDECLRIFARDEYCRTSITASERDYIFLGDSHAASLYVGMFDYPTIEHNSYLVVANGCMPILATEVFVDYRVSLPCLDPDGPTRQIRELQQLGEDASRVVLIVGRYSLIESQDLMVRATNELYHYRPAGSLDALSTELSATAFEQGLESMVQTLLQDSRNQVVFVHQVPEFPFLPRNCLRTLTSTKGWACGVSRAVVDAHYRTYTDAVNRVLARYPQVAQFAPMDFLCDAEQCYSVLDGRLLYYDNNHVNMRGAKMLLDKIIAQHR